VLIALLVLALVLWLVLIVLGFAVKTLFWLGIIGIVLFLVTAAVGLGKLLTKPGA
jgi:hypothetical protein